MQSLVAAQFDEVEVTDFSRCGNLSTPGVVQLSSIMAT
jgi:hypothetical protein